MRQPLPFTQTAELDLLWDWTPWLEGSGIATFDVTAPASVTVMSQTISGAEITAWVKLNRTVPTLTELNIVCAVVTNDTPARHDSRLIKLIVEPR